MAKHMCICHLKNLCCFSDGDASGSVQHAVAVARCIGIATGLVTGDHWSDASLDTIAFKIYDILKRELMIYA